ncbi:MAG: aminopeptidase P N-terminal domain-containing protein [Bacteroidota bacterium]
MKYLPINPELFKLNRKRYTAEIKPNSIAIFNSNDMMPRNGDCFFPFRQNSDLFYLSGIDQEESVLVLYPDCIKAGFQEVLFLRKTNEHIAIWEGHKYTKEEATKTSGIQKVFWLEDMDRILNEMILLADNVYLNTNENDRYVHEVPTRDYRFAQMMRDRYPAHNYYRSQPIMKRLGMIKSEYEIDLLKTCCDITEKAFRRVLDFVKPGVWEYEIEAEITYEFLLNRATGHGYTPIVGSGRNACVLHYIDNNMQCKAGDVLLMDFGAEYGNYTADLSRSIPVSGTFTDRQRAVYNSVLKVMREATNMLRPGTNIEAYHKEVGKIMESELIGLGLLDAEKVAKQDPDAPLYKQYFMHGTSHHLGLDVHDLAERYAEFQPGMVFTCEPGIYILEEELGIRLENDILVTDGDPIDLMATIPVDVDEIESLMNAGITV